MAATYDSLHHSVIIGGGFASFTATLSLLSQGHKVTLIDNKVEDNLLEKIYLPPNFVQQLCEFTNVAAKWGIKFIANLDASLYTLVIPDAIKTTDDLDVNFFKLIEQNKAVVRVADFKSYLWAKLKQLLNTKELVLPQHFYQLSKLDDNVQLDLFAKLFMRADLLPLPQLSKVVRFFGLYLEKISAQTHKLTGELRLLVGPEHKVLAIDGENQALRLQSALGCEVILFNNLIDATDNRLISDLFKSCNPNHQFSVTSLPVPKHNHYASAVFTLVGTNTLPTLICAELANSLTVSDLQDLATIGWTHSYVPFIFCHIMHNQCYIAGEIPFDLQDKPQIAKYFNDILKLLLTKFASDTAIKPLYVQDAYQVATDYMENHKTLGQKGNFIILGQGAVPSNFLYGHAIARSLQQGWKVGACLEADNKDLILELQQNAIKEYSLVAEQMEFFRADSAYNASEITTLAATALTQPLTFDWQRLLKPIPSEYKLSVVQAKQ